MAWWWRWCMLVLGLVAGPAAAVVTLGAADTWRPLAREVLYLREDDARMGVEQAMALPAAAWRANDAAVFSRGYDDAAWWLRFEVRREAAGRAHDLVEIAYPVLDHLDAWILREGRVLHHYRMGDKQPFASRPIAHRHFLLPLRLEPGQDYTVLLRVRTASSVQVPLALWDERAHAAQDQIRLVAEGLYFGTMLAMVLYNLFVFLIVRERNYLYYVLYAGSILLFMASLNGLAFQFLWPAATTWNDQAIITSLAATVFFGTLFTLRFLRLRQHLPRLVPALRLLLFVAPALMAAAFFVGYSVLIRVVIVVAAVACATGLVASLLRWLQGDASARLYALAWSAMLAGGIVLALNKFQLLPQNAWTENAAQVGSALEVLLLSFAMAQRITVEKRLRFNAQQDALESERRARHAQAEALEVQRRANETLEVRVQERTLALEEANRRLAELSATDQLTGLRNRRYLDDLLHEEFSRCFRYGHSIALLLLDIDHFKRFNDTYGHQVGDDCLRAVAGALRQAVRHQVDQVARYGGEEFCVVLPETGTEGASVVAERIRAAVEALAFSVNGARVPVTVSVGVAAMVPAGVADAHLLVLNTDNALYEAKAAGRNRVRVAS